MNEEQTSKTSSFLALALIIGLLAFCCGGPVTWFFGRQAIAKRKLEQRIAEISSRGIPVDNMSMDAFRKKTIPGKHTAAWEAILRTFESNTFTESCTDVPIVGQPDDEQTFVVGEPWKHAQTVTDFLTEWEPLRKEMHAILDDSGPIYTNITWDSFNTLLPFVQASRTATRVLQLEHFDAIQRGDSEAATRSLLAMIGVSRSLEKEPVIISQLVHTATMSVAIAQLKLAIESDLLNAEQLERILKQLNRTEPFGNRHRLASQGERAMALPAFDTPEASGLASGTIPVGSRSIDALAALDIYEKLENIDTSSLETYLREIEQIQAGIEDDFANAGPLRKFDTLMTQQTIPAVKAFCQALARQEMQLRLARLAIGVRLYQKRFGTNPESADALSVLEVELGDIQPLGPQPFGMQTTAEGIVLWGFTPQTSTDQTPASPADLASEDPNTAEMNAMWIWTLK